MSETKIIPIFDQSKPVSQVQGTKYRYLEQEGNWFTFAEWNRGKQMFEPEPVYVPRERRSVDDLRDLLKDVLFKMSELQGKLAVIQEDVLNNMEAFQRDGK